jgi:hypothetical protein
MIRQVVLHLPRPLGARTLHFIRRVVVEANEDSGQPSEQEDGAGNKDPSYSSGGDEANDSSEKDSSNDGSSDSSGSKPSASSDGGNSDSSGSKSSASSKSGSDSESDSSADSDASGPFTGAMVAVNEVFAKFFFDPLSPVHARSNETLRQALQSMPLTNGRHQEVVASATDPDIIRLLARARVVGNTTPRVFLMSIPAMVHLLTVRGAPAAMLAPILAVVEADLFRGCVPGGPMQPPVAFGAPPSEADRPASANELLRERRRQINSNGAGAAGAAANLLQALQQQGHLPSQAGAAASLRLAMQQQGHLPGQAGAAASVRQAHHHRQAHQQQGHLPGQAESSDEPEGPADMRPLMLRRPAIDFGFVRRAAHMPNFDADAPAPMIGRGAKRALPAEVEGARADDDAQEDADGDDSLNDFLSLGHLLAPARPRRMHAPAGAESEEDSEDGDEPGAPGGQARGVSASADRHLVKMREAIDREVRAVEAARLPTQLNIQKGGNASVRGARFGLKEEELTGFPQAQKEFDLFIDMASNPNPNTLRAGVFKTALAQTTVDRLKKNLLRFFGFGRNIKKISRRQMGLALFANVQLVFDYLEFLGARGCEATELSVQTRVSQWFGDAKPMVPSTGFALFCSHV